MSEPNESTSSLQQAGDPIKRQIEDLQKYLQAQHDVFLQQQPQAIQLRQTLLAQMDRCLRRATSLLKDYKSRQNIQKIILAQQQTQLTMLREQMQNGGTPALLLQQPTGDSLSAFTQAQQEVRAQMASLAEMVQQLQTVQAQTARNNSSGTSSSSGGGAAMDPMLIETLLHSLQSVKTNQEDMQTALNESMPAQFRTALDTMFARLVAAVGPKAETTAGAAVPSPTEDDAASRTLTEEPLPSEQA